MSNHQNLQSPGDVLDAIADLAPRVVIIRTDEIRTGGRHRRSVQLDRLGRRETYDLRVRDEDRARALNRLQTFAGIHKGEAEQVWSLCRQLQAINPLGTWALESEPEGDLPAITSRNRGEFGPAVEASHRALADALPGMDRIEADVVNEGSPRGHVRRRTFVRFLAGGKECCALDTAHLASTSEAIVFKSGEHAGQNLERAERWSQQLSCSLEQFSITIKELRYLVGDLSLRTLVLGEGGA